MQYLKIKEAILEKIDSESFVAREKLPSERKLAVSFNTTRITLREALASLEAEGRIYREDRRGWFIAPEPLRYDPTKTLNFMSMALQQNRQPETKLLSAKSIIATKEAAKMLNLEALSSVYRVDRVRYLEKRPVVYVTNFIQPTFFPDLLSFDLSQSITDIFRDHFLEAHGRVSYRISSSSLFGSTAQALRASAGSPAMIVERINFNKHGQLTDCDIEYWRHDAIRIESVARFADKS